MPSRTDKPAPSSFNTTQPQATQRFYHSSTTNYQHIQRDTKTRRSPLLVDRHSCLTSSKPPPTPQPFYGLFSRRELLDFMVQGRLTEADTSTIRLGVTPSGLSSAHLQHPPHFFTGRMPFLPPNVKAQLYN